MRKLCITAVAISLLGSSLAWADSSLSPGKPAGVHQAQMGSKEYIVFGGIAALAAGVLIATSGGRASNPSGQSVVVSAPTTTV
jgi:hypothetical protein